MQKRLKRKESVVDDSIKRRRSVKGGLVEVADGKIMMENKRGRAENKQKDEVYLELKEQSRYAVQPHLLRFCCPYMLFKPFIVFIVFHVTGH